MLKSILIASAISCCLPLMAQAQTPNENDKPQSGQLVACNSKEEIKRFAELSLSMKMNEAGKQVNQENAQDRATGIPCAPDHVIFTDIKRGEIVPTSSGNLQVTEITVIGVIAHNRENGEMKPQMLQRPVVQWTLMKPEGQDL